MATSTYSLNYNCKLTEDYMHAASILAASGATQPLACFLNSQMEVPPNSAMFSGSRCQAPDGTLSGLEPR